jgi:fumarate reductase subunit C
MLSVLTLSVFVPAVAWASSGPGEVVIEAARRRSRCTSGIFALFCCLVVVGIVVLVLLLMRNRRGRR